MSYCPCIRLCSFLARLLAHQVALPVLPRPPKFCETDAGAHKETPSTEKYGGFLSLCAEEVALVKGLSFTWVGRFCLGLRDSLLPRQIGCEGNCLHLYLIAGRRHLSAGIGTGPIVTYPVVRRISARALLRRNSLRISNRLRTLQRQLLALSVHSRSI